MKFKHIKINSKFIGRHSEIERLRAIGGHNEAQILVVYGRRRVGKTELLEQTFRQRRVIKIEGIEGLSQDEQRRNALEQLASYLSDPLVAKLQLESWRAFFELIAAKLPTNQRCTLYLEELQWLAGYDHRLVAELKYVWDNFLRHHGGLLLILCGSAPSFMLAEVIRSKALYNRAHHELHLQPFSVTDVAAFLGPRYSFEQILDAHLLVGGIPEYLRYLRGDRSVLVGMSKHAFTRDSFFLTEVSRVFTSSLASNTHYRDIVDYLSKTKFATRSDIVAMLNRKSGGDISAVLKDLEVCGFIESYVPYQADERSKLQRYRISDAYLQFYYKFVKPIEKRIAAGAFEHDPVSAINRRSLDTWLGFAFERLVAANQHRIAELLGFHGINYRSGAFFNRKLVRTSPGFQWDLIFDRDDRVMTFCELKYQRNPVSEGVIAEFESKLARTSIPATKGVQRVLIVAGDTTSTLRDSAYFDRIITARELLL